MFINNHLKLQHQIQNLSLCQTSIASWQLNQTPWWVVTWEASTWWELACRTWTQWWWILSNSNSWCSKWWCNSSSNSSSSSNSKLLLPWEVAWTPSQGWTVLVTLEAVLLTWAWVEVSKHSNHQCSSNSNHLRTCLEEEPSGECLHNSITISSNSSNSLWTTTKTRTMPKTTTIWKQAVTTCSFLILEPSPRTWLTRLTNPNQHHNHHRASLGVAPTIFSRHLKCPSSSSTNSSSSTIPSSSSCLCQATNNSSSNHTLTDNTSRRLYLLLQVFLHLLMIFFDNESFLND